MVPIPAGVAWEKDSLLLQDSAPCSNQTRQGLLFGLAWPEQSPKKAQKNISGTARKYYFTSWWEWGGKQIIEVEGSLRRGGSGEVVLDDLEEPEEVNGNEKIEGGSSDASARIGDWEGGFAIAPRLSDERATKSLSKCERRT